VTTALPVESVALLVAGVLGAVLVVRFVAWRLVLAMAGASMHLPLLGQSRAWARVRPVRAWLERRFPRAFSMVAARFGMRHFTGLPLTLMVLAAGYVAALLGGLAEEVIEAGAVFRWDQAVNAAFDGWRVPPLIGLFRWITALGAGPSLTAVSVTATAFLWADRRPGYILPLWVTFLGAQATTWGGKYVIDRHRPAFIPGVSEVSPSFPSGHATASMALFGFLAYAIARDLGAARPRFEVGFWSAVLIAAIGFSRVFLSVHYSTDVLAGFMVGLFWLLVGLGVREWMQSGVSGR